MSLSLCRFSRASQPIKNGFAEAALAGVRGMGSGEVLLYHLETHLFLAFPAGMVRIRFSQGKATLLLSILFQIHLRLKKVVVGWPEFPTAMYNDV